MIIVIPVSQKDYQLATQLSFFIHRMNDIQNHSLVLIFSDNIPEINRNTIVENLKYLVKNFLVKEISCLEEGWPISPNDMFKKTCLFLDNDETVKSWNETIFYWMEADVTPVRRFWADKLEEEYHKNGKSFMGIRLLTERWIDGVKTPDGTTYMTGPSLYPYPILPIVPEIETVYAVPFDIWIRHTTTKDLHETNLIHWTWCSFNYRYVNNMILGEARDIRGPQFTASSPPLSIEAVVSHGCKDGTLMQVTERLKPYIFEKNVVRTVACSNCCCK